MTPSSSPTRITPSEAVFLHGEAFAGKARLAKVKLLHNEASVSAEDLGRSILVAAFLAAEKTGDLVFETREQKKFLGLGKVRTLHALPGGTTGSWPDRSLEAAFCESARKGADRKKNDIRTIVYEWMGEDSGTPWQTVVEKLESAMAARGLLEAHEEKKMKIFSVTRYTLPETTAALRSDAALRETRALIEGCRTGRADVFELLGRQVNEAIRARTDQDFGD